MRLPRLCPALRALGLGGAVALTLATPAPAAYQAKKPPLTTPWTAKVSPSNALPEYPRPQLTRPDWRSLNGVWEYAASPEGATPTPGKALRERILVPFPVQSALSGIKRNDTSMSYRRRFAVPRDWRGRRLLLHFGAVTNRTTVWVNGREVGRHTGSYDPFSFDITHALRARGTNELLVKVVDEQAPTTNQPTGKQFPVSVSVLFPASSGIWQSVWLEPVARTHVERLVSVPDVKGKRLRLRAEVAGGEDVRVTAIARDRGRVVARASGRPGEQLDLHLRRPRLWNPGDPHLYRLEVRLRRSDRTIDRVGSYFGMRSVGLGRVGGVQRMLLNGKPLFQMGTLDQGYWPDGLYTAPTDAALRFDIAEHRRQGFNLIRKHVKVEPQRWYYWADRLGLLVWQDMPNMPIYRPVRPADEPGFERQLAAMIDTLQAHPSITTWVPFNEGWGQFDVDRIVSEVRRQDPTRLVNGNSGAANCCLAVEPKDDDIRDTHMYNGPTPIAPDHRASVIGEIGGVQARAPGHEVPRTAATPDEPGISRAGAAGLVRRQWAALEQQARTPGISGAVYTELFDVEQERAGLMTYDRRVHKVPAALMRRLNRRLIRVGSRALGPQSGRAPGGARIWHFDDGSGPSTPEATGRGGSLALEGGVRRVPGRRGGALAFDGSGGRAVSDGPVVDPRRSFTVAAWLRLDAPGQNAPAVAQVDGAQQSFALAAEAADERPDLSPGYEVYGVPRPLVEPSRWSFEVPDREADTGYGDPAPTAVGRWHHVTGVYDRSTRTMQISVDGVPLDTEVVDRAWSTLGRLVLGGSGAPGGAGFVGAVDELRTYPRALSAGEVWRLHGAERRP